MSSTYNQKDDFIAIEIRAILACSMLDNGRFWVVIDSFDGEYNCYTSRKQFNRIKQTLSLCQIPLAVFDGDRFVWCSCCKTPGQKIEFLKYWGINQGDNADIKNLVVKTEVLDELLDK